MLITILALLTIFAIVFALHISPKRDKDYTLLIVNLTFIIFLMFLLIFKAHILQYFCLEYFLTILRFFSYAGLFLVNILRYEISFKIFKLIREKVLSNVEITLIFISYSLFLFLYINFKFEGWFFSSLFLEFIGLNLPMSFFFFFFFFGVAAILLRLNLFELMYILLIFICFFFFMWNSFFICCNAMEVDNPIVPPIKIPSNLGSPSDPYNLRIIIKHGQILMVERGISTKTLPKVVIPEFLHIKPTVKENRFAWCHYHVVVPDTCKSLFDYIMAPIRCDLLKKHANWGGRDIIVTSAEHQLPYIYQICIMLWLPLYFGVRELFINLFILCNVPGVAEIHYGYRFSRVFAHAYYSNDPNDCLGTGYIKNYDGAVIILLVCRLSSLLVTYFLGVGFMDLCSNYVNFSRLFGGLFGISCLPLTIISYFSGDFVVNCFLWFIKVIVSILTKGF